ncbi:potassium transporter TrkG [Thermogladius sp. 4427co]|uniref:potassium transporter TrkG n=1 Tax=Thermogladius sp. 4427co TaxID=3450718 RepID=UPI003F7AB49E
MESIVGESVYARILLGGKPVDEHTVSNVLLFFIIHSTIIAAGAFSIKILMPGTDLIDSLFEATSAASCVGLSTGITSPLAHPGVKIVLILLMLLGKLEYLPLIVLIGLLLHRRIIKFLKI